MQEGLVTPHARTHAASKTSKTPFPFGDKWPSLSKVQNTWAGQEPPSDALHPWMPWNLWVFLTPKLGSSLWSWCGWGWREFNPTIFFCLSSLSSFFCFLSVIITPTSSELTPVRNLPKIEKGFLGQSQQWQLQLRCVSSYEQQELRTFSSPHLLIRAAAVSLSACVRSLPGNT